MEEFTDFEKAIEMIITLCNKEYEIKLLPIKIFIVDDMWETFMKLRPDLVEKPSEIADFQRSCSGSTIPPKELNGNFSILLRKDFMLNNLKKNTNSNWVSTLVHEIIHIKDCIQFVNMGGATDYDSALDVNYNMMFYLWTEFNAKTSGVFFVEKHMLIPIYDKRLSHIVEKELFDSVDDFSKKYQSTNDSIQQMYHAVHLIGILYAWQKLFPDYFSNDFIKDLLKNNIWLYELYVFLSTHDKLDIVFYEFEEMKDILKQKFHGLG